MTFLYLLVGICSVVRVYAQVCPETDVVFVLDLSENSYKAATSNNSNDKFDILKSGIRGFLNNDKIVSAGSKFSYTVIGYSSDSSPALIFTEGTSREDTLASVGSIGDGIASGGSWTYAGLEKVRSAPRKRSNILLIISSQASDVPARQERAWNETSRLLKLGWKPYVLAVKGVNKINFTELTLVNNGAVPVIVQETNQEDPKGYKALPNAFNDIINNILCTQSVPTTTPQSRSSGVCDNCILSGGYGLAFDPLYCDRFYICNPNAQPINLKCPAGTFFDGAPGCNHIHAVPCQLTPCISTTPNNTRYKSGRCCDTYYACIHGDLVEESCPPGQVFDAETSSCVNSRTRKCADKDTYICHNDLRGRAAYGCPFFSPDETGNPCFYYNDQIHTRVPAGTFWMQDMCSLVHDSSNFCSSSVTDRDLVDSTAGPAAVCNSVFSASFDGGSTDVYSERMGHRLTFYTLKNEVIFSNDSLVFTPDMHSPYFYYFFFNSRDIVPGTAFRIRFKLINPVLNTLYDILSNYFCVLCQETINFSVTATSATSRTVTVTFATTDGKVLVSTAAIEQMTESSWLEVRFIFGSSNIYGILKTVSSTGSETRRSEFTRVAKTQGVHFLFNQCGIQLGRGTSNNFLGYIDQFDMYELCQNIDSILE